MQGSTDDTLEQAKLSVIERAIGWISDNIREGDIEGCTILGDLAALRQHKPQAVAVSDGWRPTCATEGCGCKASVHFIRGDIGSYYCHDCYLKVQSLPAAPVSHGGAE